MKVTKPLIIAALVAGNLLAWNLALRADDSTNKPPVVAPAGAPTAGQRTLGQRGPNIDQLAQQLSLTDDQKTKVKSILDAQMQKMRDLRGDASLSSEDRRTKMRSIHEETMAQMKAVLTPEQFDKWQKTAQRGRRPGGPPPGGPKAGSTNAPATAP